MDPNFQVGKKESRMGKSGSGGTLWAGFSKTNIKTLGTPTSACREDIPTLCVIMCITDEPKNNTVP